ncbi:hypothetical protein PFISCL1PPCAC_7548, partial [Pristionchus fissidentatus]
VSKKWNTTVTSVFETTANLPNIFCLTFMLLTTNDELCIGAEINSKYRACFQNHRGFKKELHLREVRPHNSPHWIITDCLFHSKDDVPTLVQFCRNVGRKLDRVHVLSPTHMSETMWKDIEEVL